MLCSSQSGITKWAKLTLAFVVVASSAGLCQPSKADSLTPTMPLAGEWLAGPANAELGTVADLKVPAGYKFLGAAGARDFLEQMTNAVPKNLLGVLAPESGGWWVVLEFAELGYVKEDEKERINPAEILKALSSQRNLAGADWELKPQYDAADHSLEWAVRSPGKPQAVVSHIVRILGRHGAIDAMILRPYRGFSDLAPLKQLVQGISFKAGERYADFQNGDKVCASGLVALITGDEHLAKLAAGFAATAAPASGAEAKVPWVWVGSGLLICGGLVLGIRLMKKGGRRKSAAGQKASPAQDTASARPQPAARPAPAQPLFKAAPPASPVGAKPASPAAHKGVNGKHHGGQRKKMFDYNRYFNDLMSTVSSHANQFDGAPANGYALDASRMILPPLAQIAPLAPTVVLGANSEVIAQQQALIEEQKRLIQEQTKLIEEKTRLIAEKNQLLKLQSEFIEQKLL